MIYATQLPPKIRSALRTELCSLIDSEVFNLNELEDSLKYIVSNKEENDVRIERKKRKLRKVLSKLTDLEHKDINNGLTINKTYRDVLYFIARDIDDNYLIGTKDTENLAVTYTEFASIKDQAVDVKFYYGIDNPSGRVELLSFRIK